jgi:hypothetical protein
MLCIACIFCALVLGLHGGPAVAGVSRPNAMPDTTFECGGELEAQIWSAWDKGTRRFLEQEVLQARLLENGDVYALYDLQTYAHNLVAMARRCNRSARLMELARLAGKAYGALAPGSFFSPGRRWVCRGGSICNETNGLLDKEVVLDSVQFLGMASSVANAIATSRKPLDEEEKHFIKESVEVVAEHMLRWGSRSEIARLHRISRAAPRDVAGGSSELFFTDQPLWMITVYAELSGILASRDRHGTTISKQDIGRMREHLAALLRAFSARTSFLRMPDSRIGKVEVADIDRGYWKSYADNRFAAYDGEEKPVSCSSNNDGASGSGPPLPLFRIAPASLPRRQDIGWDFSHARRLVHALDAIERNREAMQTIFSLPAQSLPSRELAPALAGNLVAVVWNGDMARPLFANYWSGANGWFRVAYDNGTGGCNEGYPPYGMSDSFITGGYVTWARYRKEIGRLGKSLYRLTSDAEGKKSPFVTKYYPGLGAGADEDTRALTALMFLPTLVGVGIE